MRNIIKNYRKFNESYFTKEEINDIVNSYHNIVAEYISDVGEILGNSFTFFLRDKEIKIYWDDSSECMVIEGDLADNEPHEISKRELRELVG